MWLSIDSILTGYWGQKNKLLHLSCQVDLIDICFCELGMLDPWIDLGSRNHKLQSELPKPIPRNSVESNQGCTLWIYFDNAGDNVKLTLNNVTLASQKPC